MRLIDADVLKKEIHMSYSDDLCILPKIDEQPTVCNENGWISANDRLPEKKGYYLVCNNTNDYYAKYPVEVAYFRGKSKGSKHTEVTHWMPLPAPPYDCDVKDER